MFVFNIFAFDIFPFNIFPFDIFAFDIFTIQIHFYNIPKNPQMCPAHRDLPTPSPLTLGSTFHIQYRHIHITASRLFHSQQPPQAVLLHRLNLPYPIPQHTNTSQQNSHPPQPSTQKKSPRGVQRGRGFAAPLRFSYFRKKILRPFANPNETQYFSKVFFTFCYLTTRTLYMPSISLSSSNALADAALSRSIRV